MGDDERPRPSSIRAMSSINITPLIDVMLVLLIIFMVVTPLAPRGLDVSVPQSGGEPGLVPPLFVTLDDVPGTGLVISLNKSPVSSLEDLNLRLSDAFQSRPDKTIFVKAGGTVPYGRVVEAMDVARGAGAERIGVILPTR